MNRKAGFKALRAELAEVRSACGQGGDMPGRVYLIARMARDLPQDEWEEYCKTHSLADWFALPLPPGLGEENQDCRKELGAWLEASPWVLSRAAFKMRLGSELLRIARGGSPMCLLLASVAGGDGLETDAQARLDAILGDTLDGLLEACDSLCTLEANVFGVILPGLGQLKSRRLAEKVQTIFRKAAEAVFADAPDCAAGLVNVSQGECASPALLLERARKALDLALGDKSHIYQESPTGDACGATLVHSNEKHFLFFGGVPK